MPNKIHYDLLNEGVDFWNTCRNELRTKWIQNRASLSEIEEAFLRPDLRGAKLVQKNLNGYDLSNTDLRMAKILDTDISGAILSNSDLRGAMFVDSDLHNTDLSNTKLREADFTSTYLNHCVLTNADFYGARLSNSILSNANLQFANLTETDLLRVYLPEASLTNSHLTNIKALKCDFSGADLTSANMKQSTFIDCNFSYSNLCNANLFESNLSLSIFVQTNIAGANITGCRVYGLSAWNLIGEPAQQENLVITPHTETAVTVDDLKVAQFIYLLLNNNNVRDVIDTITSKVVLILGRFTEERKKILDAIRVELRNLNYTPILFDFKKPSNRDVLGTIEILARMARFVIVDLTDPSSVPLELGTIVPFLNTTVVLPIKLRNSQAGFTMFDDLHKRYDKWVLKTHYYEDLNSLILSLPEVIAPAIVRANELINII